MTSTVHSCQMAMPQVITREAEVFKKVIGTSPNQLNTKKYLPVHLGHMLLAIIRGVEASKRVTTTDQSQLSTERNQYGAVILLPKVIYLQILVVHGS